MVFVVALALWAGASWGQDPVRFRSVETVGFSNGSSGSFGQVQTINGVAKGTWFAGLGVGLDYYRFRSVPLFLSLSRDLAIGKRDWLYLFLNGGTDVAWYKRNLSGQDYIISSTFHGGAYWSGGLGYLWKLGEHSNKAVLLSAGYTQKKVKEHQTTAGGNCCCDIPCPLETPATMPAVYEYICRAYQLMIGFRF